MSSEELHDLAVRRAAKRLDVGFFWQLLSAVPSAEAGVGQLDKAEADVQSLLARLDDVSDSGKGSLAEALRPLYLDYLTKDSEDG